MSRSHLTIILLILSFLSFDLLASAQASGPEQVSKATEKVLKKARKLEMKGKGGKAAKLYEIALTTDNLNGVDQAILSKKLANRYIYMGRGLDAIELVGDVDFDKNRDRKLLQNLLREAIAYERYSDALSWIETYGTGYNENSYHDYRTRSVVYGLMGRMDDVKQAIQNYAEKQPNDILVKEAYMASLQTLNREAVRVASGMNAVMPADAKRSGHCIFTVGITPLGTVREFTEANCTEDIFQAPSYKVVKTYVYLPKLANGVAVSAIDDSVKVTYKLMDKNGKIVPELGF